MTGVVAVEDVRFSYGERTALRGVSFDVAGEEIFGLLGPNGGGKTTLFRLLCTLLPFQSGHAEIAGHDVAGEPAAVRRAIGVTFQAPSLDGKLTVRENLRVQGMLYGLRGSDLEQRMTFASESLGIRDRWPDRAETLSGGLKRRVEIAKGLLHDPRVLLLDEPSTGLDPSARADLWQMLGRLRDEGMTILVTTHLMEEAERCGRLGILHQGELVALGTPGELRGGLGGDCLTLRGRDRDRLSKLLADRFETTPRIVGETVRLEHENAARLLAEIVETFPAEIDSASLGKPTLEDVFISRTGHRFWEAEVPQ